MNRISVTVLAGLASVCFANAAIAATAAEPVFKAVKGASLQAFELRIVSGQARRGFSRAMVHPAADISRSYYASNKPLADFSFVATTTVQRCQPGFDEPLAWSANVAFRADHKDSVLRLTGEHLDETLGVFANGKLLIAARISQAFTTGLQVCVAGLTRDSAIGIARELAGYDSRH